MKKAFKTFEITKMSSVSSKVSSKSVHKIFWHHDSTSIFTETWRIWRMGCKLVPDRRQEESSHCVRVAASNWCFESPHKWDIIYTSFPLSFNWSIQSGCDRGKVMLVCNEHLLPTILHITCICSFRPIQNLNAKYLQLFMSAWGRKTFSL